MTCEKMGGVPPLSYSSMNEIFGCEQKYAYRKVLQLSPDEDYSQETDALDVGTVFHECLESCKHDLNGFKYSDLLEKIGAYESLEPDTHGPLLWAMLKKYKLMHESVGLTPLHVELELEYKKEYRGFLDLVLVEDKGVWITDMKTASYVSRFLKSRLVRDPQLSLYADYYKRIMKDSLPILGCRYRVVTKTKLKRKKEESLAAYCGRIEKSINAYEYVIPIDAMEPTVILDSTFKKARDRQKKLHRDATPVKNFSHCDSYFRPCEYWSRCHGKMFSEQTQVTEKSW